MPAKMPVEMTSNLIVSLLINTLKTAILLYASF